MNPKETRMERDRRSKRLNHLKMLFLYNEKEQVFTGEEMDDIKKEFFALFNVKENLRSQPKYTVSEKLNEKIEKVLEAINIKKFKRGL